MKEVMSNVVKKNVLQKRRADYYRAYRAAVLAAGLALFGAATTTAQAQTIGASVPIDGGSVESILGFGAFIVPSSLPPFGTTPTALAFPGGGFNFIANPYMAVVLGVQGDFGWGYAAGQLFGNAVTANHLTAGMISFGNLGGSLRTSADDKRAMNGFGFGETYDGGFNFIGNAGGVPLGYGVWPLAGRWAVPPLYDYSAYVAANVDGVQANGTVTGGTPVGIVGGSGTVPGGVASTWVRTPSFSSTIAPVSGSGTIRNEPNLLSEATLITGTTGIVSLIQDVTLYRNTAKMTWWVKNLDSVAHTVFLKFVVNHRSTERIVVAGTTFNITDNAYFYADPTKGPTLRAQVYGINPDGTATQPIPASLDVYGARFQTDTVTDANGEPFHTRHLLTGGDATTPTTVFFGDSEDLYPDAAFVHSGRFSPPPSGTRYEKLEDGAAVAVYFGPINVPAGSISSPVITYYGNGASTDRYDADFTIGTEAEEAFQYNANAVNTLTSSQRNNPSLTDTAKAFLTPSQLTIFGNVYNRQLSESQFNVTLTGVTMSVTLPDGLRFGINPTTGKADSATKSVGDVSGDTQATNTWVAEPTGEVFGTSSYQFTTSVGGIAPLSRTVSRAVTIPATPLHNVTADSFQMIGFPFDFDPALTNNGDSASIINGLSQPTDTNPGSKIFYKWVPDPDSVDATGKYVPTTTLQRGVGYYYRPALSRLLFLNGAMPNATATPVDPTITSTYYQIVLERGWNMITDPWIYGVPVNYISLATINQVDPPSDLQLINFSDAVASGLVRGGIFFYNTATQNYDFFQDFSQELKPYQAYWVYVDNRSVLRIAVPSQRQSAVIPAPDGSVPPTRKEPVGAFASGRALPANMSNTNWKVQISAKRAGANASASAQDSATLLGVSPTAKDGDDSKDLPKPPPLVNDYVAVSIQHSIKSGKVGRFAQDLKSPGGSKSWDMQVVSDKDGPVSLSWPNLSRLPRTVRLTLTDANGRKVNLRGSSSTTVNVSAGVPTKFTITADSQPSRMLAFTNVKLTNSGRAQGGGSNYTLAFHVTADATVEAKVMSLSGRTVGILSTGRAVSSGEEVRLLWQGRSVDGSALPAGPYTIQLNARTDSGEATTMIRPITVLR